MAILIDRYKETLVNAIDDELARLCGQISKTKQASSLLINELRKEEADAAQDMANALESQQRLIDSMMEMLRSFRNMAF